MINHPLSLSFLSATIALFIVIAFSPDYIRADDSCPAFVDDALGVIATACGGIGRNEACYGNIQIDAVLRDDAFTFAAEGDITPLNALDTMRLSPFDAISEAWGIALMRLQANLPETLPGAAVTVLAFGDVSLENAVPDVSGLLVTTTASARVRTLPQVDENPQHIINSIPEGNTLRAIGRDEMGEWLFLELEGFGRVNRGVFEHGWISVQVLSGAADRMSLPVVDSARGYLLVLTFLVEILMLARCGNQKVLQPAVPILLPVELVEW